VCALSIASVVTSDPMTLASGEGFSVDMGTSENVRVTVISDSRDLRINGVLMGVDGVEAYTHMEEVSSF
jgi:hypothetical protein